MKGNIVILLVIVFLNLFEMVHKNDAYINKQNTFVAFWQEEWEGVYNLNYDNV